LVFEDLGAGAALVVLAGAVVFLDGAGVAFLDAAGALVALVLLVLPATGAVTVPVLMGVGLTYVVPGTHSFNDGLHVNEVAVVTPPDVKIGAPALPTVVAGEVTTGLGL